MPRTATQTDLMSSKDTVLEESDDDGFGPVPEWIKQRKQPTDYVVMGSNGWCWSSERQPLIPG